MQSGCLNKRQFTKELIFSKTSNAFQSGTPHFIRKFITEKFHVMWLHVNGIFLNDARKRTFPGILQRGW